MKAPISCRAVGWMILQFSRIILPIVGKIYLCADYDSLWLCRAAIYPLSYINAPMEYIYSISRRKWEPKRDVSSGSFYFFSLVDGVTIRVEDCTSLARE